MWLGPDTDCTFPSHSPACWPLAQRGRWVRVTSPLPTPLPPCYSRLIHHPDQRPSSSLPAPRSNSFRPSAPRQVGAGIDILVSWVSGQRGWVLRPRPHGSGVEPAWRPGSCLRSVLHAFALDPPPAALPVAFQTWEGSPARRDGRGEAPGHPRAAPVGARACPALRCLRDRCPGLGVSPNDSHLSSSFKF